MMEVTGVVAELQLSLLLQLRAAKGGQGEGELLSRAACSAPAPAHQELSELCEEIFSLWL